MPERQQAGSGVSNANIRGELLTGVYGAGKPQYELDLYERFGLEFNGFNNIVRTLYGKKGVVIGAISDTTIPDRSLYETNRMYRTVMVGSTITIIDNTHATFTLDPSMYDTNGNAWGRVTEVMMFPSNTEIWISSITGTAPNLVYAVTCPNVGANLTTEFAALPNNGVGWNFIITNGAKASGTGSITPTSVGWTREDFWLQILDEKVSWEGAEFVRDYWFKTYKNGKPFGMTSADIARAEKMLNKKISYAMLFGQQTTNPTMTMLTPDGNNNLVKKMEGLIPKINTQGYPMNSPDGSFTNATPYTMAQYWLQEGVEGNMSILLPGFFKRHEIDEAMKAYIQNNGTDFTSVAADYFGWGATGSDKRKYALKMGFKELEFDGVHYLINTLFDWSDPMGAGATGYLKDHDFLAFPVTSFKDASSGVLSKNMSELYAIRNGYSRELEVWNLDGAGGRNAYVTDVDKATTILRSEVGFMAACVNQCIYGTH